MSTDSNLFSKFYIKLIFLYQSRCFSGIEMFDYRVWISPYEKYRNSSMLLFLNINAAFQKPEKERSYTDKLVANLIPVAIAIPINTIEIESSRH